MKLIEENHIIVFNFKFQNIRSNFNKSKCIDCIKYIDTAIVTTRYEFKHELCIIINNDCIQQIRFHFSNMIKWDMRSKRAGIVDYYEL